MSSPFTFTDTRLNIKTEDGKEIIITKTNKAGKFRLFGSKFLGGDSLYQIIIREGDKIITTLSDLTLDQMMEVFSDNIDDITLCSLLNMLKQEFPSNNKPQHFTGFKGKQSEICGRIDKKESYKKFRIDGSDFLICLVRNKYSGVIQYNIYVRDTTGRELNGISLYKLLGVKGKWVKIYSSGDKYLQLIQKIIAGGNTTNKNTNLYREVSNDLKDEFHRCISIQEKDLTCRDLTDAQIGKILEYSIKLEGNQYLEMNNIASKKNYITIGEKNKNYENISGNPSS